MNEVTKNLTGFDKEITPSADQEELVGNLIKDWQYLFGLRGNWNSHWSEIAERIYPMHAYLFQNFSQLTQQGDKRNFNVYDSTGIVALQRFGAIMDSLLTPRNQFWHQIRPDDDLLLRDKATTIWFQKVNDLLFAERYAPAANFASQNQLQYKSLGAYGTGALLIDDLAGTKGLRYRNIHLGELYLQENHQGVVDRVCRHFTMEARQAVQKFGASCPENISSIAEKFPARQFFFLHWVMPRTDRDPFRKDFKGMEFASYYISVEGSKLVAEGGYRTFPYSISRYEQAPNEAYGRSPAMDVLPAIKTLNEQKRAMLKQGHRTVDPVILAYDDGVIDAFTLEAGAVNYGGVSKDGRPLVQTLPVGNVQAGKELMDDERQLINDTFLVSLFQILVEGPTDQTATEVMERIKEKGILLAPTVGRQQSEYLGPMIDREIDILSRQGRLPPMPRLLASAKGKYKIVYDSPISRTQKAERVSGAMRTMEAFGQYAQMTQDPSILDLINMDVAGPQIADANGVPAAWMNTAEDVMKIRQMRQQQQQQQKMIEAAPAAAGIMKAQAAAGGKRTA